MTRLRSLRPSITIRAVAVVLALAALIGITVERGLAWQERREHRAAAEAASAAAVTQVEKLITISGSNARESVESLLDGTTGDFRAELEGQAGRLRRVLIDSKVNATGEVVATGVVSASDDRATVLVAATGSVRNKQDDDPQARNYRLSVDLEKVGDHWLVSGLEFVS